MTIFDLHSQVLTDHRDFVGSFIGQRPIADPRCNVDFFYAPNVCVYASLPSVVSDRTEAPSPVEYLT